MTTTHPQDRYKIESNLLLVIVIVGGAYYVLKERDRWSIALIAVLAIAATTTITEIDAPAEGS